MFCSDADLQAPSLDTDLAAVVRWLRDIRGTTPDRIHGDLNHRLVRLDNLIIPLWRIQRQMDYHGPLELPESLTVGFFDVYVTDVTPKSLPKEISDDMGVQNLSPTDKSMHWPIIGKVWGIRRRIMFTLPVTIRGKSILAHFLFDTGGPATFIARDTLNAFGMQEHLLGSENVRINGVVVPGILLSDSQDSHFKGINLLGMDYLFRVNAMLSIDMKEMQAKLEKQNI